jgi:phage-related protein (TIGR01555 family)
MKLNFNGVPNITPAQYHAIRRELRFDGWKSALSGVGYASFDKRETVTFEADVVTIPDAREMWRGDDLAKRIIETVPNESVREGFKFCAGEDSGGMEIAERVMEKWKELDVYGNIKMARCFERAYGGGALLVGADDGQKDWSRPLNPKAVRRIDFLTWFEPEELIPLRWYSNWRKPKFGKPALFQLNPYNLGMAYEDARDQDRLRSIEYIHESRLITFNGARIGRNMGMTLNAGWGDNVLTPTKRTLRDFNMSWSSASVLVMEFATPIFKMKGLDQLIAMDRDDEFKRRIQAAQLARSVLRAMLIDAEEEFTREQTPISGLPELLDRFSTRLAAAADMPVTLLMGQSPAGLNATGESDIRFFYDRTKGSQTVHEVPAIEKVSRLIMTAMGITPPKAWSIEPNPLWQPTEKEQADTRQVQAQTDNVYLMAGVLSPQEVKKNRFTADGGSLSTFLDEEGEEDTAELPPDAREVPTPEGQPAPAAPTTPGAPAAPQQFNGAQVAAAQGIVASIGKKEIPSEAGQEMLKFFFGIPEEVAKRMAAPFTAQPDPSQPKPTAPPVGDKPTPEKEEKMDWDPDQPREENGQWAGEGSGGSSGGDKEAAIARARDPLSKAKENLAARGDNPARGLPPERIRRELAALDKLPDSQTVRESREQLKQALEEHRAKEQESADHAAYQRSQELSKAQTPITGGKSYSVETPEQTAARLKGQRELKTAMQMKSPAKLQAEQKAFEQQKALDLQRSKENVAGRTAAPSTHERLAQAGNDHSDRARQLAAEGKLREAAAETRRAAEAFKSATKAASPQESRNEAKARRARERRERARQEASKTPEQAQASATAAKERASKEKPPESKGEAKARRARERRLRAKGQ